LVDRRDPVVGVVHDDGALSRVQLLPANFIYHYVVVRTDIATGDQFAQVVHAAGESARLAKELPQDTRAVALGVKDKASLEALESRLLAAGIAHSAIREPDAPYSGELVAIGCAPVPRQQLRKLMSSFRLLR
jgi:peptidyl-tRNA hydrolase